MLILAGSMKTQSLHLGGLTSLGMTAGTDTLGFPLALAAVLSTGNEIPPVFLSSKFTVQVYSRTPECGLSCIVQLIGKELL